MKRLVSISLFILAGSWYPQVFRYSVHFFDKPSLDLSAIVILFIIGILGGRMMRGARLIIPPELAWMVLSVISLCAIPVSHYLNSFTPYSALPVHTGSLLTGLLIGSTAGRYLTGIMAGLISAFLSWSWIFAIEAMVVTTFLALVINSNARLKLSLYLVPVIAALFLADRTIPFYSNQQQYYDNLVMSKETAHHQVDITEWKGRLWFYLNGKNQFSSFDHHLYYEPFIHPAASLVGSLYDVLIIGGENGLALREILKYPSVKEVVVMPVDSQYLSISRKDPHFMTLHDNIFNDARVSVEVTDPFDNLENSGREWDMIILDIPDPVDIPSNQYFTRELYLLALKTLHEEGVLVTQSLSPYLSPGSYASVRETLFSATPSVCSLHNQVPTLGEWSWTIATLTERDIQAELFSMDTFKVATDWLDPEALRMSLSFGKNYLPAEEAQVNTIEKPVLYRKLLNESGEK